MIRPTLEKCVVVGQLLDTRSLGGQLLVCGPLGLLDFVFRAFGRSGRVTHAYVSMMHVSMMHVSMMHVSMIHVSMMYVPMIHVSMVHVSMMHVYMMHVSIMLDYAACVYDAAEIL